MSIREKAIKMEPVNDSDSSSDDDDSVDSSSSSDNSSDDDAASHNSSDDSTNSQQDDLDDENMSVDREQEANDDSDNSENSQDSSQEEYQDEYKSLRERILEKEARGSKKYSAGRSDKKSKALQKAMKGLESFKKKRKLQQQQQNAKQQNDTTIQMPPKKKKKSKHKPTEMSSKRADFFARGAKRFHESGLGVDDIGAHRYKPMDPRLSNLTGHFDEDRFSRNYAFLEEMRNQEIGQLRKQMQAHKQTGKKGNRMRRKHQLQQTDMEETQTKLKTLTETRANLERQKMDRAAKQSVKRKLKQDIESGKSGVYFLKRKEKKRLELEAKYEQMSKTRGKDFQKVLSKKRQKNKSKDAGVFVK